MRLMETGNEDTRLMETGNEVNTVGNQKQGEWSRNKAS